MTCEKCGEDIFDCSCEEEQDISVFSEKDTPSMYGYIGEYDE